MRVLGSGHDDARGQRRAGRRRSHRRRARRRRRAHARASGCRARSLALADANGWPLADDRSVRRRVGSGIVHRPAHRHRDDAGARVRRTAGASSRVSALEALAHAGSADLPAGALVGAWMDAHRGDVFAALYRVAAAPPFEPRAADRDRRRRRSAAPAATLARWRDARPRLPAIVRRRRRRAVRRPTIARDVRQTVVAAAAAARRRDRPAGASTRARPQALDPRPVRPLYVRRPDAEIARDEK